MSTEMEVYGWVADPARQMITIKVSNQLESGRQYKILMKFVAILNNELRGFYRSSYEENGVIK